tara:strand:- start:1211 stop:1363 length:153 start_codon:yes stop_codon:yes gene_type:complete
MVTLTAMTRVIGTPPVNRMELPVERKYFEMDDSGDDETASANAAAGRVKN